MVATIFQGHSKNIQRVNSIRFEMLSKVFIIQIMAMYIWKLASTLSQILVYVIFVLARIVSKSVEHHFCWIQPFWMKIWRRKEEEEKKKNPFQLIKQQHISKLCFCNYLSGIASDYVKLHFFKQLEYNRTAVSLLPTVISRRELNM